MHSELLLCLAAGRSIDAALKHLGLKDTTTGAPLTSFDSATVVTEAAALLLESPSTSINGGENVGSGGGENAAEGPVPTAWSWEALEASSWE